MNTPSIALPLRRMLWASYRAWWGNFSVRMRPPGPMLLQWLWTGVFCVQIALVLTGVAWAFNDGRISAASVLWTDLQVSLCVGYTIHTLFYASGVAMHRQQINPDRFAPMGRFVYYAGVPLLGTGLGVALFLTLRGYNPLHALLESPRTVLSILAISVSISGFLFFVWLSGERRRLLEAAAAR
ncbi:MAG: hypothetical protein KGQ77_10350, partial [Betaproteobacteria bacterium]|nr:hypothetical protein [Betaproteobacteria bacterium]